MITLQSTETDYVAMDSTFTICRLLAYTVQAGGSLTTPHAQETRETVFQINHARILEPKGNENVFTNNGERLFPLVQVIDTSGALVLKMREKAALEVSGQTSKEAFAELASKGGIELSSIMQLADTITPGAPEHAAKHARIFWREAKQFPRRYRRQRRSDDCGSYGAGTMSSSHAECFDGLLDSIGARFAFG